MKTRPALLLLLSLPVLLIAQPAREHVLRQASPILSSSPAHTFANAVPTLAERLGFKASDRVLIVNGDDVGMSHAANAATIDAMENGLMTSATIMVPCPWFPEIAAYAKAHPNSDFGLHLTHTSEWKTYRWGPVASKSDVPGLVDPDGYLWPDIRSVYKNSTPEQAEREARAQIKKALAAGVDVTHLDSHMGALQFDDRYFQVYRKLAKEFDVPLRMGSQEILAGAGGGHQRAQLEADGILYPDNLVYGGRKPGESVKDYWKRMLSALKPGVTELYIHAALAGEEMRSITNSWQERATEYELFTKDPDIRELLNSQNVKRVGFRALRDLQRKSRQPNAGQTRI